MFPSVAIVACDRDKTGHSWTIDALTNAVGKGSNPVRVVHLRPASDHCARFGTGYGETAFACLEARVR